MKGPYCPGIRAVRHRISTMDGADTIALVAGLFQETLVSETVADSVKTLGG